MTPISDEEQARRTTRAEASKRAFIIFTAFMVTISLAILVALAIQGAHRGRENQELLKTVQDCTQPTGQCYQRGRNATASAVSNINQVIILAAACSAGLPPELSVAERQTRIQSCVINRLAAHGR